MSKLSNTLLMLSFLKSGRKYQISELASLLEVSNRMIRIYKEDLEKSSIYIDTIKRTLWWLHMLKYKLLTNTFIFQRRYRKE